LRAHTHTHTHTRAQLTQSGAEQHARSEEHSCRHHDTQDIELGILSSDSPIAQQQQQHQHQSQASGVQEESTKHCSHPESSPDTVTGSLRGVGGSQGGQGGRRRKWPGMIVLWDRFPKFVLGFLVLSVFISLLALGPMGVGAHGQRSLDVLLGDLTGASNWWFYIGFVGIGINTDVVKMAQKLQGGSILYLYLAGQTFNVSDFLFNAWNV